MRSWSGVFIDPDLAAFELVKQERNENIQPKG